MKKTLKLIRRNFKKPFLKLSQVYFNMVGSKVECNLCHFKTNKFNSNRWHLYCDCPYCSSNIRLRLLVASLTYINEFSLDNIIKNKKVLHFAPEKSLQRIIKENAKVYKTADFLAEGYSYDRIDFNIDISDMKNIDNDSFDCIIACDVLEHVPDHIRGIKEVYRILNTGGYCIFTVPQKDNLKNTYEDLSITDKKGREKAFGQYDHLRIYGDDFITILQDSGFEVTAVDESFFNKSIVDRFVLFPPILSNHPFATNYRKIFFGRKK